MNAAFQKYKGCQINGKWYGKDELALGTYTEADNVSQALRFAKALFDASNSLTVQTSGSTGTPKAISFSKSAFVQSAKATNDFFDLGESSETLLTLPLRYIAGKMMVVRAIVGRHRLTILEPSACSMRRKIQADFIPLTPAQLNAQIVDIDSSRIKTILVGGGAVSHALKSKILKANLSAYASFGMTETLSHFALAKISEENSVFYTTLPGVEIKTDEASRLMVNWPGITDGWLATNDIAKLQAGGFTWLGRADNLINSGGIKIIPEEVEAKLQAQIQNDYFVYGLPDSTFGEVAVLFIEGIPAQLSIETTQWDSPYHKPKRIIWVDKFERTISGKTQRKATVENWQKAQP